jgi:hypothetical protein
MPVHTSIVTTKGQTRVHPSPELDQLAGCLKPDVPCIGTAEEKRAGRVYRWQRTHRPPAGSGCLAG